MNNSNKTLLQILVETLPKVGGWPEGVAAMAQDADGAVQNYRDTKDIIIDGEYARGTSRISYSYSIGIDEVAAASDRLTAIITRDQYEAALAASKELRHYQVSTEHYTADVSAGKTANATGANGWIDWHGGECPVDSDAIVEVKFRKPCPLHFSNDRAGDFAWSHTGSIDDIIAYRLVNKHELETACIDRRSDAVKHSNAQLESDMNECEARDEILYELANFAATTKTSLDIGVATEIAIWLSGKGYRKQ